MHKAVMSFVAFSPDGTRILTVSKDKTARVWDAKTGKAVTPPLEHPFPLDCGDFSPDGRRVIAAAGTGVPTSAQVWDAFSGVPIFSLNHPRDIWSARFSPEGRHILTASGDKTVQLWAASTGRPSASPIYHSSEVHCARFSPDGHSLVSASHDGMARVWNSDTGQPISPPFRHNDQIYWADFSPDGRSVGTAASDRSSRVWDVATGQPITPLFYQNTQGYEPIVRVPEAAFSPDGNFLATVNQDNTVKIWRIRGPEHTDSELELWSCILSASEIDKTGSPALLTPAAFERKWRQVQALAH
jgi:WD40 repeat protein